jgi:hypothetical protein
VSPKESRCGEFLLLPPQPSDCRSFSVGIRGIFVAIFPFRRLISSSAVIFLMSTLYSCTLVVWETSHMSDIRHMSVAMQRLIDFISMVTHKRNNTERSQQWKETTISIVSA